MAVSKAAVRLFLNRNLDEYDRVKKLSDKALDKKLAAMRPRPHFHTVPDKHQKACFLIGATRASFLFFLDLGLGKSKLMLDVIAHRIKRGQIKRALILCPYYVHIESWMDECALHAPGLRAVPLFGGTAERLQLIEDNPDAQLFILNSQGFTAMCRKAGTPAGKGKRKMVTDPAAVRRFAEFFDCMVLDECQLYIKNHTAVTYQILDKMANTVKYRYGLTGTPFGRDPHALWSQFKVIDRGITLGPTLGLFRGAYFNTKVNFWGGYEHTFKKKMEPVLHRALKHRSITYEDSECHWLPEAVARRRVVHMPEEIKPYYHAVRRTIKHAGKDYRVKEQAFIRMRQLTSGFMGVKGAAGDIGETVEIEFDENPKIEALHSLIEDLPLRRKMLVYHEYVWTGRRLERLCKELGVGYATLRGETEDPVAEFRRFRGDPKCTVFIVNNTSGSVGLNLQVANYTVFFESPVAPDVRRQAEKRSRRRGQVRRRVFYYDLFMRGSVDFTISKWIRDGRDLHYALLHGAEVAL